MSQSSWRVEHVVIGAGVIGLAVARALLRSGREVLLLEAESRAGQHCSTRNSGVIHAGIYYPPGSLKARLCCEGRELLYRYCEEHGLAHRRIGKLLLALDDSQLSLLKNYQQRAQANGVSDLLWLDRSALQAMEPAVQAQAALFSPSTGIVDSAALLDCLLAEVLQLGATVAYNSPVSAGSLQDDGVHLQVAGAEPCALQARWVINCAGLQAPALASAVEGMPVQHRPAGYFARGHYFALSGAQPFSHLIYPLPEPGGLGIHLTLDLAGQARFGPDVQWLPASCAGDYTVDESRREAFVRAIQRYYPGLDAARLQPDYAGIRPKLSEPGAADSDFVIRGGARQGLPHWINLLGIESPGLTSCLAIAREVLALIERDQG